jgi:lipopolysaccharide transport system permease protein
MKESRPAVVTYEPDNSLKKGYFQIFGEIISEIISNRWLTYQMFRRNFFAVYKQSLIGILWVVILPIMNVGVFAVLNNSGVFNIGEIPIAYPIFAVSGMAFWQIFAGGLGACGIALTSAGDMITRINFSKKSLIFAPMGKVLVSFLVQMALVILLFILYRMMPSPGIFLVPVVVVPVILFTLGLGFLVSIMNAVVRDVGNILSLGITFLMYLTPILYAKPRFGILAYATQYNPMYYFVTAGRDLLFYGRLSSPEGFLISCAFSAALFVVALVVFHLTETRITERI